MNVLLIAPSQGAFGGIEAFVLALADEICDCNYSVKVVFKEVSGFQFRDTLRKSIKSKEYSIVFLPKSRIFQLSKYLVWANTVHGHNPLMEPVFGSIWYKKPCVLTVYNWCRLNLHIRPLLWRVANIFSNSLYISDFVWNSWERNRIVGSGKLPIVSNLPSNVTPYEERKGFIFASRWIPNKGLRTLIRAYSNARIDKEAWPLVILGDGPLKQEVISLIESLGTDGIFIAGFLSDEDRNQKISQAMWMVTPPDTKEDLGLTAIEARNVKVPCIITADGGLTEAAGKHSLCCNPNDIQSLSELLEYASRFSREDYELLAEATWQELQNYLMPLSVYQRAYQLI